MAYRVEYYEEFELLAKAMIYVKAAAEAGGSVNLYKCPATGLIEGAIEGEMYYEDYLPTFGTLIEDPDPEPSDYETDEEFEEAVRNHKLMFTLNENGWKLAKQIQQLCDSMESIAPKQAQIDKWMKKSIEASKKEHPIWFQD